MHKNWEHIVRNDEERSFFHRKKEKETLVTTNSEIHGLVLQPCLLVCTVPTHIHQNLLEIFLIVF